jgi:hypothetical protein
MAYNNAATGGGGGAGLGTSLPGGSLYQPGMTYQQLQAAFNADPTYQQLRSKFLQTQAPGDWLALNRYAGQRGLYDLSAAGPRDSGGAFRSGASRYGIGGDGTITESHDSAWNPATAGTLLNIGLGAATGAGALGAFGGGGAAGGGAGAGAGGAGLAGVEGGGYGLGSGAVAGLGSGAMGSTAVGGTAAGLGGAAGAGEAFDAAGNFIGPSTVTGNAVGGAGITGGSVARSLLNNANDVANVLGSVYGGRAAGREAAAYDNQRQALADASIYNTRMGAALTGPRRSASDAAFGDTLANVQPFSWTGSTQKVGNIPVPQSTGGLGPQNFGPATRKAGQDLATLGASRVNSPSFALPNPPVLPPLPQAGGVDSFLGSASTIAGLLGLANNIYRDR